MTREQIGLIVKLDLGYERKKGVEGDPTYFDMEDKKEFPFIEMEKKQLRGSIGHPWNMLSM